jgi:glycosyltransferase involved in cell wall biosynthesis
MLPFPQKIALVHDWFSVYTGSERVVEQILKIYPQADLFSLVDFFPSNQRAFLQNKPVQTSFIQRLPFARRSFRQYLPLMPLAIEQFDMSPYDLVISSSHAVAKGVITGPNQLHVSYIHSPIRYAWDMQADYLRDSGLDRGLKGIITRMILHYIRMWDHRTMNGVDAAAANSQFIAQRIWKVYRRNAEVIYPPVDIYNFSCVDEKEPYYLTVARLVPYKKLDLIVNAFAEMPDRKLVVIGDGPELMRIRKMATPNVEVLGYQPTQVIIAKMQRAKAFIFAAQEDFGITPLEAQACGTPVIAFDKGGVGETIRGLDDDQPTGVFFSEQNAHALVQAVDLFEMNAGRITSRACRENAERFAPEQFEKKFSAFVLTAWEAYQSTSNNKHEDQTFMLDR